VIGDANLGQRIVLRKFVGIGGEGRPVYTDLLGELVALDAERVTVRTEDGTEHAVDRADVVAAKAVPPRPVRFSEIIALEWAAASTWPAPVQGRLGEWLLRSAEGWTARANSALPLGDPGLPLPAAIDALVDWYAAHGRPPAVTVPLPVARRVQDEVLARGWRPQPVTLVLTVGLTELLAAVPDRAGPVVDLRERPSEGWLTLVAGRKSGLPASAHHILSGPRRVRFAEVYADAPAGVAAIARGALSADGHWLGLALVEVVEAHRRRGLAQHVTGALARWAVECGAERAFLQVLADNGPARALYQRLGFTPHHRYVTLAPPRSAADQASPLRRGGGGQLRTTRGGLAR
jgi:GNAT superfamily N-acetyltransferase